MTTREIIKAKMATDKLAGIVRTYPLNGSPGRKVAPPVPPRERCVKLGGPTGETVLCPTCTGRVALNVFSCADPAIGKCLPTKSVVGYGCCPTCPSYLPSSASVQEISVAPPSSDTIQTAS